MSYAMNFHIICCKNCVAPKRHPGCHGHCPEYLSEKTEYEAQKAEIDKRNYIKKGLDAQAAAAVYRAKKIREWRK